MDLNSIMNSDGGAGGASKRPAPASLAKTPSSGPPPHTPVQAHHPAHAFRDYSQTVHASPGPAPAASPREHPSSAHPSFPTPGPYASPTSYNAPPSAFPSRPPPIQPPSAANDPRSPGSASASHQSPYRHTPASSLGAASGAYPFPPQGQSQPPASPQQRHQYGQQPGAYPRDSRDSYSSQPGSAPVGMPTHHGSMSYVPGQQAVPQTPPVGTPGGGNHAHMQQQQQQQQQMLQQQQQLHQQQQHHHHHHHHQQQQQQQQQQQHHHQRSQSAQSATTSTPTSAHAPHPPPVFGTPSAYGHPHGSMGSPVVMTHQPHLDQQNQNHQRQASQPPTPLSGSSSMTPRLLSGVANNSINFSQPPPSPYQQRAPPSAAPLSTYPSHPQHVPTHSSPYHNSPPPPPPSAISRIPSTSSHTVPYDGASDSHRRSQSQASRSERDRSISVSPKTRVPSLPSSAGDIPTTNTRPPSSKGPIPIPPAAPPGPSQPPNIPPAPAIPTPSASAMEGIQHQHPISQRENTPAKRKMDDRDLRRDEVEGTTDRRPPPPGVNGNHGGKNAVLRQSVSPKMARRKKARYCATPPAWAVSGRSHQPETSRNYCLSSKSHHHATTPTAGGLVNGNGHSHAEDSIKSEHASRHASPDAARSVGGGPAVKLEDSQPPPVVAARDDAALQFEGRPFPLQCVNLLQKQLDYTVKAVGDHLYFNVINNPNLAEIQARGIHFEIEVKFGTIIDRNSETRLSLPFPCGGEVILPPDARVAFRSSMAENQHREINQWLNTVVCTTNERNPPGGRPNPPHVPMHYTHHRQTDRFYELNQALVPRLPFAMQKAIGPRNPLKVRVSTDQKTNKMLAKIVKTRVGDLNIFMPHHPVDCRISINLEWDWDGPIDEIVSNQIAGRGQPDRNKDRLSYEHGFFQVDLTQVTKPGPPPSKEHELEIEMNASTLLEHGRRLVADPPQENKYTDLVETLVDNIRAVAKKCPQAA